MFNLFTLNVVLVDERIIAHCRFFSLQSFHYFLIIIRLSNCQYFFCFSDCNLVRLFLHLANTLLLRQFVLGYKCKS